MTSGTPPSEPRPRGSPSIDPDDHAPDSDPATPQPAIEISHLDKRYGATQALSQVSLRLPRGSVTLLAGPNGAGKTTLLRVLMDLIPAEEGMVEVFGLRPARSGAAIRAGVGFVPEELECPFGFMKVRELLDFESKFRPRWDPAYAKTLAADLELPMARRWNQLSKGQRRRVQIVRALAHRPPLLLLDEPTDGLDPVGREVVLELLAAHLADTGATALYCTHVLSEAQGLADRLVVLRNGRVRVADSIDALRGTLFRVSFSTEAGSPPLPALPFDDAGEASPGLIRVRRERTELGLERWIVRGPREAILAWADDAGLPEPSVDPLSPADAALAYLSPSHRTESP